jgi:bacterioferritin-associated ferredoxin
MPRSTRLTTSSQRSAAAREVSSYRKLCYSRARLKALVDGSQRPCSPSNRKRSHPDIVCSCNVLSDHAIRNVVTASREQPLSTQRVYVCLSCSIRCGHCARAVKRIITEASTMAGYREAIFPRAGNVM